MPQLTVHVACHLLSFPPADTPALRHYSYNYKFYGAVPGAQLVIRMVSEINNYDYIADMWLSNDGVMDVRVVTSG